MRLHRALEKKAQKVDVDRVANRTEDFLDVFRMYKQDLSGTRGLIGPDRMKSILKKIDDFERDILKLEGKIERLEERRAFEAVKLEDALINNFSVLEEYLSPDEMMDFR